MAKEWANKDKYHPSNGGRADLIGPRPDQLVPFSQPPGTGSGAGNGRGQPRPVYRPGGGQRFTTKGVPLRK